MKLRSANQIFDKLLKYGTFVKKRRTFMKNTARFSLLFLFCLLPFPLKAKWQQRQIGADLKFELFVSESSSDKRPLMVHLHGCLQETKTLREHANWEDVASSNSMIVALPSVPRGGVYAGCWDYYGPNHQRDSRHNQAILEMVELLMKDKNLNIDPKKVFITGFSSGGGQAFVLACLAPEIFAGVGLVAGPLIGTEVTEISRPKTTTEQGLANCLELAGEQRDALKNQLATILVAPNDSVVSPKHGEMTKEMLQLLYQTTVVEKLDLKDFPGVKPEGSLEVYRDEQGVRFSFIEHLGLGHNWPSGQGGSNVGFTYKNGLNFPAYLTKFFLENQRR